MAKYELKILLLISLSYLVGYSSSKSCFAKENNPYKLFASKTAYNQVRGHSTREIDYLGCTPVQFYFISRHGTRYPKAYDIKQMRHRLPVIRDLIVVSAANNIGKLCSEDINNLKSWHFHLLEDQENRLTPTGEHELKGIGMRYRSRFIDFFQKIKSRRGIDVRSTTTARTQDSAKFFMMGLLGDEAKSTAIVEDDVMLRFYKECHLWKEIVDKNAEAVLEASKFKDGPKMVDVVKEVSKRIGLKNHLNISDIELMYDACRFEAAWDEDVVSPWCAAFDNKDLKTLEYAEDIKYYYKHGYGHTINYDQACPPVQDIVERFMSKMEGNRSEPNVVLRFSHSGMMLKLLARLGLFKDKIPLTCLNFKKQKERAWRTSNIDCFAANLALVLFDCKYEHRVAAYFQEREIQIPGCTSTPCAMPEFLHAFESIAKNCNVDKICSY